MSMQGRNLRNAGRRKRIQVSYLDGSKYNCSKSEQKRLREVSGCLCREYGLAVIENPMIAPSRPLYLDEKSGKPTRYNVYREDLREAINGSRDLQHMILLREHGSGIRETFEQVIETAGFSVSPVWEATSTTALVNAVINGLGIAVLPHRMVIGPIERGLAAVRVNGLISFISRAFPQDNRRFGGRVANLADGVDGDLYNFTQILHKSSFRFYIGRISFDDRKIL